MKREKTKVIILGGGFAGSYAALELNRAIGKGAPLEATLIDKQGFLMFTPMLPEVVSGTLEPAACINAHRKLLPRIHCLKAEIRHIDTEGKKISVIFPESGMEKKYAFDHLVIALGNKPNFFGMKSLAQEAYSAKTLDDAVNIRKKILSNLELADACDDQGQKRKLLTILLAGGGFAGAEVAASVNEFIRQAIRYYPNLSSDMLRVMLVHPGEVIMPELPEDLGRYGQEHLAQKGIELVLNTLVSGYSESQVVLSNGKTVDAGMIIWTAGNKPHPILETLSCEKNRGYLAVDEYFQVKGASCVWALGDCAAVPDIMTGKLHPPTAQHAVREAKQAVGNILSVIRGEEKKPFRFKILGQMASLGRGCGVAYFLGMKLKGFWGWVIWKLVYLHKLPGFAKRARVWMNWEWEAFFGKDIIDY